MTDSGDDAPLWRPWPAVAGTVPPGAVPWAALPSALHHPALRPCWRGLALRAAVWTSTEPLPVRTACLAVGLDLPCALIAGGADNTPDRARLRRWLATPEACTRQRSARQALHEQARATLTLDNASPEALAGLDHLAAAHGFLDGVATMGGLLAGAVPAHRDQFAEDAHQGALWLLQPGRLDHIAEHQAWPLPEATGPLREHRWLEAFVRMQLHLGGMDQSEPLTALFDALEPAPLRWYEGWGGIPPDTDSLGVWLRVAGLLGRPTDPRIDAWLAPLRQLAPEIPAGTWLPTEAEADPAQWGGQHCRGVQAACALGLIAIAPKAEALRARVLVAAAKVQAAWHYPPDVAQAWAAEAWWAARTCGIAPAGPAPVEPLVRDCSSPQALAAGIPAAIARDADIDDIVAILRTLARAQRPDGSWPPEPLFVIPGKPPRRAARLLSPEVTTAMCVRAMMLGVRRLKEQ